MTPLTRRALARLALTTAEVERLYKLPVHPAADTHAAVKALCESHERLRAELDGAAAMLATLERKVVHGCTDATCRECDG